MTYVAHTEKSPIPQSKRSVGQTNLLITDDKFKRVNIVTKSLVSAMLAADVLMFCDSSNVQKYVCFAQTH